MTNELLVNFPVPPVAVMPEPAQTVFLWLTIALAVAVIVVALVMCRRYGSPAPLLMVIGGFAAIAMEPILTFLGHAIHPELGQILMFKTVDRAIPWHIGLGYMAAFGAVYLILYPKMVARSLQASFVWKLMFAIATTYAVFEIVPVSYGLWVYYEYQPLRPSAMMAPVTWNFLNACSEITSATVMYVAMSRLRGVGLLLLVPLAAVGATMAHVGAGLPMYNAMNTDWPAWAIQLSGVATVLFALMLVWLCTVVIGLVQAAPTSAR